MRRQAFLIAALALLARAQDAASPPLPDAQAIMTKVAANMESAAVERRLWVYQQNVKASMVRTNGQVARRESREYLAVPGPERTEKKLVSLAGEYHKSKKEVIRYSEPGFKTGGGDLDGGIMEDLVDGLVNSKKSRDGIPASLFPLSSRELPFYRYTYKGTQEVQGRQAFRIAFEPSRKSNCVNIGDDDKDENDNCPTPWKGEALIDAEECQPVRIFTDLDFKMPWGVKVFLGTNLRQTGFSITYTRVAANVWFPSSYGTEFRLDVLFGYKRVITLALESKGFQRTSAQSEISFEAVKP